MPVDDVPPDVAVRLVRALDRNPSSVVTLVDRDLRIRWVSHSATWVTGTDPTTRAGADSLERIHPDDVERLLHGLAQLAELRAQRPDAGGNVPVLEPIRYRFKRFDGQWVVLEAQVHNLMDDPVVDGMLVLARPVDTGVDAIGHVVDLLVADAPASEVLAACAGLVPSYLGSAAVVGLLGDHRDQVVVGAPADSPARRLVTDERWWRGAIADGRVRAPVDFAGFPDDLAATARAEGFRSAWVQPLADPTSDDVIGCVVVWVRLPVEANIASDQALLQTGRLAALVIGEERRHHALRREAVTDPLTGLGNRSALRRRLDAAAEPVTVAIIDLDQFKPVNDTYGHDAGDEVLKVVAERLLTSVREDDLVVRFGGDEFAVVFADDASAEGVARSAQRIVAALEAQIALDDDVTVTVGASLGLATAPVAEVIHRADAALYEAKRAKGPSA